MSPKNTTTELDPEALATLRQARATAAQLRNMGIPIQPLEPQPLKQEKPNVVKNEPVTTYDNFIPIQNLPSKGLFYRNKLHGQALKMEDLIQIQSMDDSNLIPNFTEIYSRRLRGVDAEEILTADELYIALWLRASSFPDSDHYKGGFTCSNEECKFKMTDPTYRVPFQQITFETETMPDEVFKLHQEHGYVEETLPESGKVIQIELRRRYHSRIIDDVLYSEFYSKEVLPKPHQLNLLKIASVVKIDDIVLEDAEALKKRLDVINNISTKDSYQLIKYINNNSFMADPVVNHICPLCGTVTKSRGYLFRIEEYLPADYGK